MEYKIIRKYKSGKVLYSQLTKKGLFGYNQPSEDSNKILLFPDNTYKIHIYTGFAGKRGNLRIDNKKYQFRGYY